jgi:nicotinamide-nucleotide amidase
MEFLLSEPPANSPFAARSNSFIFKICGLSRMELADLAAGIDLARNARFSITENYPDLTLHLTIDTADESKGLRLRDRVRAVLGSHSYAEDERSLEEVVGASLLRQGKTLALAESCSGGYISHRITRIAGSSAYYIGGAVTYANDAKVRFLGVKHETLERYGAVSRETALEMSQGIRERTGASIGLSVTGIAGPSGGSIEKPVGTVWLSIASNDFHEARRFQFTGERERIILATSQAALDWLRLCLL